MYLYLGHATVVSHEDIIGLFDMDNTTSSHRTRATLERAEREGRMVNLASDLPASFVVCSKKIYLTQFSTASLSRRMENNSFE